MASPRILANSDLVKLGTDPTYDPILCEVSHSFSAQANSVDATCKSDSARYKIPTIPDYTFTVSAKLDYSVTASVYTFDEVVAAFEAGTELDFQIGTTAQGDTIFTGKALVSGFEKSASLDEVADWSASFEVTVFNTAVNA